RSAGLPVLPVRYETLVPQPERELRRITDHVGLPFDAALLHPGDAPPDRLDAHGRAIGRTDPARPIAARSIGVHENFFSDAELRDITSCTASVWQQLLALEERERSP